nr:hypothetical protein [Prevotella sp. MA2016]
MSNFVVIHYQLWSCTFTALYLIGKYSEILVTILVKVIYRTGDVTLAYVEGDGGLVGYRRIAYERIAATAGKGQDCYCTK